jgi:hypothetical protein
VEVSDRDSQVLMHAGIESRPLWVSTGGTLLGCDARGHCARRCRLGRASSPGGEGRVRSMMPRRSRPGSRGFCRSPTTSAIDSVGATGRLLRTSPRSP